MSATARKKAPNAEDIRARKGGDPLVSLTAYTTPMARLMDEHCDFVLVGDSVGMVLHGLESTLGVTMEMMILHGQAVARGLSGAMMVIDMPFGSYEAFSGGCLSQCRPPDGGDRRGRGQAGRRGRDGRNHPFSGQAWHSCDGPYRLDASVDQHAGRLQGAGPGRTGRRGVG